MARVLITGMSGVGKSTVLGELADRGHSVVDTDYGDWIEEVPWDDGSGSEPLWREDLMADLLDGHTGGHLFVSGTVANQGKFYSRFDSVVLLSAPIEVLLERVASRTTSSFGKDPDERDRIIGDTAEIEPLLRSGAAEIDARRPLHEVVDTLLEIADACG